MKSFLLKLSGLVIGSPVIATGQGLQKTGHGLKAVGDACVNAGVVTEIAGIGVREHFKTEAELAAEVANQREMAGLARRLEKKITALDDLAAQSEAKASSLQSEREVLASQLGQVRKRLFVDDEVEAEGPRPAPVAMFPGYA